MIGHGKLLLIGLRALFTTGEESMRKKCMNYVAATPLAIAIADPPMLHAGRRGPTA
jgi:hypothetical protein